MKLIKFGLLGGGWRAEFYIRIAKQLSHMFQVSCVYIRDPQKAILFQQKWNVPVTSSLEEFAEINQQHFIVVSISKTNITTELIRLSELNIPILAETPPAVTFEEIKELYSLRHQMKHIQFAEQYIYQPLHAARLSLIQSNIIGEVNHVQVSVAHGYHGINLIRQWLNISNEACTIIGSKTNLPVVEGPTRHAVPSEHNLVSTPHELAILHFENGKTALFDFSREQYFSPIRSQRVLIQGTKGEIITDQVNWTPAPGQYNREELKTQVAGLRGELRSLSIQGIQYAGNWLYKNPFFPSALSEEEIAIAQVLLHMNRFVHEGMTFYSLEDALLDTYIALKMEQSLTHKQTVVANFKEIDNADSK